MLRKGVWMAIILAIFSALTACAHIKNGGGAEALEPKKGIEGRTEAPEQNNSVVGHWEALEPKSGLVSILEFRPDGTSRSSLLVRVNMRYRIEGDKLIMTPENKPADKEISTNQTEAKQDEQAKILDNGSEPVIDTFVLENDRLKLTLDKTGDFVDLQREGQATVPNSIVGSWSFKLQNGESGREIFYANGTNEIKSPLPGGTEGSYEVKKDVITVSSLDKQHSQSVKFKLEKGKLELNDGKKITAYIRVSDPK
jgi:hypothetical protein